MLKGSVTARTGSSDCRLPDDDTDAHAGEPVCLGERAPDQHIRVVAKLWQKRRAAELDVGLVDQDDGARRGVRDAAEIRNRDQAASRIARRVQEDHPRPRRDRAAMTASVGNTNSGPGGIRTAVAPTADVEFGYGSNAGSGMIVSASWIRARAM